MDYYDDKTDSAEAEPKTAAEDRNEDSSEQTALIPKSILGGKDCQPGEELAMKVVHVYEDEVEVEFAGYNNDSKKRSAMDNAEGGLDKYAKEM